MFTRNPTVNGQENKLAIFPPNDGSPGWRFLLAETYPEWEPYISSISVSTTDTLVITEYFSDDILYYFTVEQKNNPSEMTFDR